MIFRLVNEEHFDLKKRPNSFFFLIHESLIFNFPDFYFAEMSRNFHIFFLLVSIIQVGNSADSSEITHKPAGIYVRLNQKAVDYVAGKFICDW